MFKDFVEPLPIEQNVNKITGERAPKRQKEIARVLYQASLLPDELIKLIIDYDNLLLHNEAILKSWTRKQTSI
jgi:hypothetical protein